MSGNERASGGNVVGSEHPLILPDALSRLGDLGPFARGTAPHGWHVPASDEALVAALLASQLRRREMWSGPSMREVYIEIMRRQERASVDINSTNSRGLQLKSMAYGHVLTRHGLERGTMMRIERRAQRVMQFVFGLTIQYDDEAARKRLIRSAPDVLLIDVMFWRMFVRQKGLRLDAPEHPANTPRDDLDSHGNPRWLVDEIRARIHALYDPELNPDVLHGGRPTTPHTPIPRLDTWAGEPARSHASVELYRRTHNLAADHPFWTTDRILAAVNLGME